MENNIFFYSYIKSTITFSVYCQTAQYVTNYRIPQFYMKLTHKDCSNETYIGNALDERVKTVKRYFPRAP
jgi:hypothetical protein